MKTFEVCVVSKEYRTVHVQAEDEEQARDITWDLLTNGTEELPVVGQVDVETDLYVEGELT